MLNATARPVERDGLPLVSVIIPTLNEAGYLDAALRSLQAQTYPGDRIEILIVDGGSRDATVAVAEEAAAADGRIRVMGGPGVNCPAALNIGIGAARGSLVWYIGGHGEADPRFVELGVEDLLAEPNLGAVGGEIIPVGESPTARANFIARFSVFGVGRGVYTTSATRHDIETVQWGLYRKRALEDAGLFDADLQFGEDEELNFRIRRTGRRILYDPRLKISYVARPTLRGLFRQYRNYGRARVRVLRKHPSFFRLKHVVPSALIVTLAVSLLIALIVPSVWWLPALAFGGYAGFIVVASLMLAAKAQFGKPHAVALSLLAIHFGYGLGMLGGLIDLVRRR